MYETILLTHIITMIASLILMSTASVLALLGVRQSVRVATVGVAMTGIGFASGSVLLLQSPILSHCIALTAYIIAMTALYGIGFAWGNAPKARLVRSRLS